MHQSFKSRAISTLADAGKVSYPATYSKGIYRLVIDREPLPVMNDAGAVIGVDVSVRLFRRRYEMPIDGHRVIINPPQAVEHGKEPSPNKALVTALWDSVLNTPNAHMWRKPHGTVTTIYASTADGYLQSASATYSTARSGGSIGVVDATTSLVVGQFWFNSTNLYTCYQTFLSFDCSVISSGDVVSDAVLEMYLNGIGADGTLAANFTAEARAKTWLPSLTSADYVPGANLGSQTLYATRASSGIGSTGAYKAFTSEAALISAVQGLGTVEMVIASDRQRLNNAPTPSGIWDEYLTFASADTSGTAQDPKLVVTHAPPPPTITAVEPSQGREGTRVKLTGTLFGSTQGSGKIELGSGNVYGSATLVDQTVASWSDTEVEIDLVPGALTPGTVYVYATNNNGGVSDPIAFTLLEPQTEPLAPSVPGPRRMWAVVYDGSETRKGVVNSIMDAEIDEAIREIWKASFTAPYTGIIEDGDIIDICRAGEGVLFTGKVTGIDESEDRDRRLLKIELESLAIELRRHETGRSVLMLDTAIQDGLNALLDETGWTGIVSGSGYVNRTKEFVNQSIAAAIDEFATTHGAYWRQTHNTREVEIKKSHSQSGIVLMDRGGTIGGRLGIIKSFRSIKRDATSVRNRLSAEIKSDSSRLITLQESDRTDPYEIQSGLKRPPRPVDYLSEWVMEDFNNPINAIGENRYSLFVTATPAITTASVATMGGQFMARHSRDAVGFSFAGLFGGTPPKGNPAVVFKDYLEDGISLAGVVTLENIDQINPVRDVKFNANDNTGSIAATVDTEPGDIVLGIVYNYEGAGTTSAATSGLELIGAGPDSFDFLSFWAMEADGTSKTLTWNMSVSTDGRFVYVVSLRPAKKHYIEDAVSVAKYGVSEETISLGSFSEVEVDRTEIANAAYDYLLDVMAKAKNGQTHYNVEASYLPGSPLDWLPGDSIRTISRRRGMDADLICVRRKHSYDRNGIRRWNLDLATVAEFNRDGTFVLAEIIRRLSSAQSNQV